MKSKDLENFRLRKSDDLVKLAQELGYDTSPKQLLCNNGASVSGLLNFFDDNPDAMEAVRDWILENCDVDADDETDDENNEVETESVNRDEKFPCCGGNDDHPPEHCTDCDLNEKKES